MSILDKIRDHREIAKDLELYILNEKAGQGLPILLPNWVIIYNQIQNFLRQKQQEYGFQEVITPILGNEYLYQNSGHLDYYQDYMFPALSCNNETFRLRPMTCPHHCLVYQQKPRSYRDLPFRLCENAILHRYETSGSLKGLERVRCFELADHHIFVAAEKLLTELKTNYQFIADILATFNLEISRLVCSLRDPTQPKKYHSATEIWNYSESILQKALDELGLNYVVLAGEAAFYGPKLDLEVKAADGKNITLATLQLDFVLPAKFGLQYIDQGQKLPNPVLIHQSPIGAYQRFIALLLEQTDGKLPFWLTPCQVVILPLNEEPEVKNYCQKLATELKKVDLRVKIIAEKTLNYRIRQIYRKKIPYYLVIGKEEIVTKKLKLITTFQPQEKNEFSVGELSKKLQAEAKVF